MQSVFRSLQANCQGHGCRFIRWCGLKSWLGAAGGRRQEAAGVSNGCEGCWGRKGAAERRRRGTRARDTRLTARPVGAAPKLARVRSRSLSPRYHNQTLSLVNNIFPTSPHNVYYPYHKVIESFIHKFEQLPFDR
ncbi:hypothetical protein RR46_14813 [Papilio xuthus]|uniref:Uncharacterized protein n=1 Tax=Papilio xuthus TaxID=66420 RepID=A0A194PF29_PAPXU|nr:hypothetical protein RR46_14813 [Papilio xuthus]